MQEYAIRYSLQTAITKCEINEERSGPTKASTPTPPSYRQIVRESVRPKTVVPDLMHEHAHTQSSQVYKPALRAPVRVPVAWVTRRHKNSSSYFATCLLSCPHTSSNTLHGSSWHFVLRSFNDPYRNVPNIIIIIIIIVVVVVIVVVAAAAAKYSPYSLQISNF